MTLLPVSALANAVDLPRTSEIFEIDGHLDEAAWQAAMQVELAYEINPAENEPARVITRALLIEDGENLYVAFEADDPEPDAIRAYLRDRDKAWEDDYVGIVLDTYNDERRAFEFYANPLGVQMDKTLDDTANRGSWEIDDSWDAIWESAGHVNERGYIVEMRIPLSQLRFPDIEGKKTWGFNLKRAYPRDRNFEFSNNQRDRGRNCTLCQVGKLQGLEGSRPSRDLEIVPTVTASQTETTEDPAIEPIQSGDPTAEAGLTVRWGVTPDLTANLTINPDFSQIEADVAQLDVNNRFTLSFPEKRPFFLEGADYFRTPLQAVFTRSVSEPDMGAKLTGKKGPNTFGLFAAEDAVTNLLFPGLYSSDSETLEQSNTAFVGRYSYGFRNTSAIGGIVTGRKGDDYHNYVAGIDGRWKISDQHSIEFQHVQSDTEYPTSTAIEFEQPLESFSGAGTKIDYRYDTRTWYARANFYDYDSGLRLDSGFEKQVGGVFGKLMLGRVIYSSGNAWWHRMRAVVAVDRLEDQDGQLAERTTMARFAIGGAWQSVASVVLMDIKERDEGVLYDMTRARVFFEFVPVAGLGIGLTSQFGDQIDYTNNRLGKKRSFEPSVRWNIGRNLLLRLQGVYAELDTPDGTPIFEATLADTRLTWQFNLRSFLRLTVQYQDVERNTDVYIEPTDAREREVGRQLLYSYKINPQTVFFLGYSDQYMDNDALDGLTASDRTVFMKVGYAWTP